MLAEQAGRRRRSSPDAVIRIIIDGIERGRLNPAEQSSISFSAEEDAEIIEVKTTDQHGDLLLATHLLTALREDAHDAAIVSSIQLEGGQELSLSITRRKSEASGGADLLVKFGYRETSLRRAASLWWQRLNLRLSTEQDSLVGRRKNISATHSHLRQRGSDLRAELSRVCETKVASNKWTSQTSVVVQTATPTQVNQQINGSAEAAPKSQPARRTKNDRSLAAKTPSSPRADAPAQTRDEEVADDATRSGSGVANLRLSEVKKIYIEIRGDAAFNELRSNLVERLGSSGVVTAATNADEADAALKIVVSQSGSQIEASALLVNARGTVLWPKARRRYSGETTKVGVRDSQRFIIRDQAGPRRRYPPVESWVMVRLNLYAEGVR